MRRRLPEELGQSRPLPTREEGVYLEIQRASHVTGRWIAQTLKAWGLSESQLTVLRILRGCGPLGLSHTAIGQRMVRQDPDLTRLLDRLEALGLVAKSRDVGDRRVVRARITEAGRAVVKRASEATRRTLVTALRPLGPARLATLARLLARVRESNPNAPRATATPTLIRTPMRGGGYRRSPSAGGGGNQGPGRAGRTEPVRDAEQRKSFGPAGQAGIQITRTQRSEP